MPAITSMLQEMLLLTGHKDVISFNDPHKALSI